MILSQLAACSVRWLGVALLSWIAAAAVGVARRQSSGPMAPALIGVGSALTLGAAAVGGDASVSLPLPWFLGVALIALVSDPLSRWFLGIIGFVGIAVAVFSAGYLQHLRKRVAVGFVWAALAVLLA